MVVFLSIAYGAVSLAAVIGNSAVLWFVVRSHRLRTVTNIFIGNLAIADILIGALAIPFQFVAALLQKWVLPHFMCAFCPFVQIVSVNVSIFTLAAIAADRYLVVVHPLNLRITKERAKKIIIVIWMIAILVAIPAAIALKVNVIPDVDESIRMKLEHFLSKANISALSPNFTIPLKYQCDNFGLDVALWKWYNRALVLIQYVIPVSVLIFAYGRMGMQLRDRQTGQRQRDKVLEDKVSDRLASGAGDSRDRSPSDIELSHPSKPTSTSLRASDAGVTTTISKEKGNPSMSANAEYIATNKRRVSPFLFMLSFDKKGFYSLFFSDQ